jgi:hypothetical protein
LGGRPNPNLSDGPEWGKTLGNAVRVWRSGIGVDAHGNLIYAAANDQTVASLAQILIRAGAVRAMQLDINSYWVTFISYAHPGGGSPSSLLPGMARGSDRGRRGFSRRSPPRARAPVPLRPGAPPLPLTA